jgi:hypothetical protein
MNCSQRSGVESLWLGEGVAPPTLSHPADGWSTDGRPPLRTLHEHTDLVLRHGGRPENGRLYKDNAGDRDDAMKQFAEGVARNE